MAPEIDVTGRVTGQEGALILTARRQTPFDGLVQCGVGSVPRGCLKGHLFNPGPALWVFMGPFWQRQNGGARRLRDFLRAHQWHGRQRGVSGRHASGGAGANPIQHHWLQQRWRGTGLIFPWRRRLFPTGRNGLTCNSGIWTCSAISSSIVWRRWPTSAPRGHTSPCSTNIMHCTRCRPRKTHSCPASLSPTTSATLRAGRAPHTQLHSEWPEGDRPTGHQPGHCLRERSESVSSVLQPRFPAARGA